MCTMAMGMDAAAMATSLAPTAIPTEAGSREAPALPPGLLTEVGEATRPTKLFIGGISRHTTTKQLRDHFSQFGRVLDCVAMRQPDGRPRGFGYVTLDSPTAAERCLREPQLIDNRIVDMKPAVPEGNGAYGGISPKEAGFNMNMFGGQADFGMDMFAGHGFSGWPETADFGNGMSWWTGARASPHGQGPDCLDLLSAARELAVSQTSSPHGLPLHSVGLCDFEGAAPWDDEQPQSTLIPAEFQQPAGASAMMSASAPEFVPLSAQAQPASINVSQSPTNKASKIEGATPPARKATTARAPLGELTNNVIVEVTAEELLKPFKSPTNKMADMGCGHLSGQQDTPTNAGFPARRVGLLLDDEDLSSPDSGASSSAFSPEELRREPVTTKVEEDVSDNVSNDDGGAQAPVSSASDSSEGNDVDIVVDMDNLPSIGSAQHATGECKRCNFFPKGRCQNGKNCQFCHFPHDKRKPSRQEKRERRALWLDQQDPSQDDEPSTDEQSPLAKVGPLLSEMRPEAAQHPAGPLLSKHGLRQGGFGYPEGEELYCDESLAFSIFPGMPPIHHATKLPAPLALPGMDMTGQMGPALPPGLVAPAQPWQPEAEASPAMMGLLEQRGLQQVVSSAPRTLAPLATVPTPLRTPASTPMSTPMVTPIATPTAAMTRTSGEARNLLASASTSTSGTQTGDYKCRRCETKETQSSKTEEEESPQGCQWARDELLRLRDGLMKLPKGLETLSGITFRTAAIAASASN